MQQREKQLLANISRFLLAAVFLFSGLAKAIDPVGGAIKMAEYFTSFGMGGLRGLAGIIAAILAGVEFMLGAVLVMGIGKRVTSRIVLLFMAFMTLLTLYLAIYNPISDCGCFGDALKLSNTQTFSKNILLLICAIVLVIYDRYSWKWLEGKWRSIAGVALALWGIGIFMLGNWFHLPALDFRPYKVGSNLRTLVLVPEGAPHDEYRYTLVYEKDGKVKEFDMDQLPDESWKYVRTEEHLVKKGYKPPVEDFILLRAAQDVTQEILQPSGAQIWVVSPNIGDLSKGMGRRLESLFQLCIVNQVAFYGISGASPENETTFRERSGASFPILQLDATTCKTMGRGNPTLFYIVDGKIVAKQNGRDLPRTEEDQIAMLKKNLSATPRGERWFARCSILIAWAMFMLFFLLFDIQNKHLLPRKRSDRTLSQA